MDKHTLTKSSNDNTELVTADKIMPILGYTNRVSFWDFARRVGLPRYQIGPRRVMFDANEIRAWLNRRKIGGVK